MLLSRSGGPAMDRHMRIQSLPAGGVFSSFDSSKVFFTYPYSLGRSNIFWVVLVGTVFFAYQVPIWIFKFNAFF